MNSPLRSDVPEEKNDVFHPFAPLAAVKRSVSDGSRYEGFKDPNLAASTST